MNILEEICARKVDHVAAQKSKISLEQLKQKIASADAPRSFLKTLRGKPGPAVIAEVKKASPSKGVICTDFDPVRIAQSYEKAGAACLSVLTDEPYFQGHDDYLAAIKNVVTMPVLRKDFMIDPYQIYESRALGADCVLLIMAALDDQLAQEIHETALALGMDVLIEIHDETELHRALRLSPAMVGINNRNLKTMAVDLDVSHRLAPLLPAGIFKISESGIATCEDVQSLISSGFQGFLIGETFMKTTDQGGTLQKIFSNILDT